jgi:hypothetical protein
MGASGNILLGKVPWMGDTDDTAHIWVQMEKKWIGRWRVWIWLDCDDDRNGSYGLPGNVSRQEGVSINDGVRLGFLFKIKPHWSAS